MSPLRNLKIKSSPQAEVCTGGGLYSPPRLCPPRPLPKTIMQAAQCSPQQLQSSVSSCCHLGRKQRATFLVFSGMSMNMSILWKSSPNVLLMGSVSEGLGREVLMSGLLKPLSLHLLALHKGAGKRPAAGSLPSPI